MNNDRSEIEKAEETLRLAMLESNVTKLDQLIDDDLLFISPDGSVQSKDDDLTLHRSGEERITRIEFQDQRVQAGPYVASVSVLAFVSGSFKGHAFQGQFRYLRVWHRTPTGWKVIAGSASAQAKL